MKRLVISSIVLVSMISFPLLASAAIVVSSGGTETANVTWPSLDGSVSSAIGSIDSTLSQMSITVTGGNPNNDSTPGKLVKFDTFLTSDELFTVATEGFFGVGSATNASLLPLLAIDLSGGSQPGSAFVQATVNFWQNSTSSLASHWLNVSVGNTDQVLISASDNDIVQSVEIKVIESGYRIEDAKLWVNPEAIIQSEPSPEPSAIPEPSTLACWLLLGVTCTGALWRRRRIAA